MSIADELGKLNQLRQEGVLSDADFEAAKSTLLAEGQLSPSAGAGNGADVFGVPLLLLPVVGIGLLYLAWSRISGDFMLIQAPTVIDSANTFFYLSLGLVLLGSAVLVGMDASRYGYGRDKKHPTGALRTGPVGWAVGQLLLWVIAYPWYIDSRRVASSQAKNLSIAAVLLALAYAASLGVVGWAIDDRVEQIRSRVQEIQQEIQRIR